MVQDFSHQLCHGPWNLDDFDVPELSMLML